MTHGNILVTGGTGALGGALVAHFCQSDSAGPTLPDEGEKSIVIANYRRDHERALSLQQRTGCRLSRADIGNEAELLAMFATLPPLYAVIHAAAISHDAALPTQSRDAWRETMRVNADGAFLVVRAALQKLVPGGRLILLGSRAGERGNRGQGAYAASKAALIALARCAAREAAAQRITVNVVCPGFVPSDLCATLGEEAFAAHLQQSIFGTTGTVTEAVATVHWLLGDGAAAISGQVIHCDSRMQ